MIDKTEWDCAVKMADNECDNLGGDLTIEQGAKLVLRGKLNGLQEALTIADVRAKLAYEATIRLQKDGIRSTASTAAHIEASVMAEELRHCIEEIEAGQ
jgi:hypothetical protein